MLTEKFMAEAQDFLKVGKLQFGRRQFLRKKGYG